MSMKRALEISLAIAVIGMLFSGFLSYRELFAAESVASCPSVGRPGTIFGYPACVYGFVMYSALVVVTTIGLFGQERPLVPEPRPARST